MLRTTSVVINQVYVFTNGKNRLQLEASSKTLAIDWFFSFYEGRDKTGYRMLYIDKKGDLKEVDLNAAYQRRTQRG